MGKKARKKFSSCLCIWNTNSNKNLLSSQGTNFQIQSSRKTVSKRLTAPPVTSSEVYLRYFSSTKFIRFLCLQNESVQKHQRIKVLNKFLLTKNIWVKVFKNGPIKIFGRERLLKNLKRYDLLRQTMPLQIF